MDTATKYNTLIEKIPAVFDAGKALGGGTDRYDEGFEAGKEAQHTQDWESRYESLGTVFALGFAGRTWNDYTFRPTRDIKPNGSATSMFQYSAVTNLKKIFDDRGIKFDFSTTSNMTYCFAHSLITHLPKIDLSKCTAIANLCNSSTHLVYIEEIVFSKTALPSTMFQNCSALVELRVGGSIENNGLNFQWCPLSHDSLMSIINALADKTGDTSGTTWEVTLGEENLAKLTTEEIGIADAKGWDLG